MSEAATGAPSMPDMMDAVSDSQFWLGLAEIIGVNIVLSGDNAVVIALAARSLPKSQQKKAIVAGSAAAIVLRILLTAVAAKALALPWLKLVGSLLLLWIGVQLLMPEDGDGTDEAKAAGNLISAVRTILIADLVMSLDNVLAVAAAAHGNFLLLVLGLCISIPLIVFGSTAILKLMERYPIVITAGAGLLGYVAGEMLMSEPVLDRFDFPRYVELLVPWVGAAFVVGVGRWLAVRRRRTGERPAA